MDLKTIKGRLDHLQKKTEKKEKVDYTKSYWKPKPGKSTVRIVPSKFNKSNPFQEIFFHYGLTKAPIMALSNFGEKDPVVEFANKLKATKEQDNWETAKKLFPKMRVFVPVLVRGEESNGVRLWEFGKEIYLQLLSMAEDEDIGDFTDLVEGRDIIVETSSPSENGTKYNKSTVRVKTKTSQLSEDKEEVKKFLNEQPDIFSLYKRYSFDELKDVLLSWLTPDESETPSTTEVVEEEDAPEVTEVAKPKYSLPKTPAKKTTADDFDKLFETKAK